MNVVEIPYPKLIRRVDARPIDASVVAGLRESIREVGIINPLRVRPTTIFEYGKPVEGFEITAGAHRFEAARLECFKIFPCIVVADDDLRAELAMIDENLMRAELSPADRARGTARRKVIYLELHPKTAHGGDRVSEQVARSATCSFADATAAATGRKARTIRQDAERGTKISTEALDLLAGTDLDTGIFLDQLKKIHQPEQADYVRQALAERENLSAQPTTKAVEPISIDPQEAWISELLSVFKRGRPNWRQFGLAAIQSASPDYPTIDYLQKLRKELKEAKSKTKAAHQDAAIHREEAKQAKAARYEMLRQFECEKSRADAAEAELARFRAGRALNLTKLAKVCALRDRTDSPGERAAADSTIKAMAEAAGLSVRQAMSALKHNDEKARRKSNEDAWSDILDEVFGS